MNKISSPLVPNYSALLVERFEANKVVSKYKTLGLDVGNYFKEPVFYLYQCEATGYRFFYPPSILGDAHFYKELSLKRENYYSQRWEHRAGLNFIKEGDKVLEIGSGFGSFLELLRSEGIEAQGTELNSHAVRRCQDRKLNVEKKLIEDLSTDYKEHFDVVCTFQVLEHIYDVHNFMENKLKTLKKGGRLIIGVPNNNPYLFIKDKYHTLNLPPHHAGLWNRNSLVSLEKIFNLKVDKLLIEPLSCSYEGFINFYLSQIGSNRIRRIITSLETKNRRYLKKILPKVIDGRNILIVYKKL